MKALYMCPSVNIKIMGVDIWARLIVLDSKDLDVILGMNWLGRHDATIQCAKRTILLTSSSGEKIELVCTLPSAAEGSVHQLDDKSLEDIKVVCDYSNVFPDELLGMPPDRDVEFVIDVLSGTAPISKRPYRMSSDQLLELKKQIKDLLEKGFIRPSSSPWGHWLSLWRRRMVLRGCVSIIDCLMMLLSRISTHCPILRICLIR